MGIAKCFICDFDYSRIVARKSNQCMEIERYILLFLLDRSIQHGSFCLGLVDVILVTAFCLFLHGSLHITLLSFIVAVFISCGSDRLYLLWNAVQ